MRAFLILSPYFSQNALKGGLVKPSIAKLPPSCEYTLRSQCLTFQRLHNSLNFFMLGLRDRRFEWNQNDSTGWPSTILRPG